jgi:hypothetical protein
LSSTTVNPFTSDTIETDYVDGPNARYAYRRFGNWRGNRSSERVGD